MKRDEAEDGSVFFCVIKYPSMIWRVQKMVSGPNGKFWRDEEGVWHKYGSYWTPVFLTEWEAKIEEGSKNMTSYMKANQQELKWKNTSKNISDYITNPRRG